jgi:hypothetical protein
MYRFIQLTVIPAEGEVHASACNLAKILFQFVEEKTNQTFIFPTAAETTTVKLIKPCSYVLSISIISKMGKENQEYVKLECFSCAGRLSLRFTFFFFCWFCISYRICFQFIYILALNTTGVRMQIAHASAWACAPKWSVHNWKVQVGLADGDSVTMLLSGFFDRVNRFRMQSNLHRATKN